MQPKAKDVVVVAVGAKWKCNGVCYIGAAGEAVMDAGGAGVRSC